MNTTNFDKLSDEKRLSVLNAGILCFAKSGYTKTAISEIADEAGISKAAIFHYFGTKKDLYLYLYKYACEELIAEISGGTKDFFECLSEYMQARIRLSKKHPGMYEFLRFEGQKKDYEDIDELGSIAKEKCEQNVAMLFDNVDWSRFQECYDRDTAKNIANWVSVGCLAQLADTMPEDKVYAEAERYLAILKKALYKPEYL